MTATELYIGSLQNLVKESPTRLALLRAHADQSLSNSVPGFDLFTALWWPLRQHHVKTPRREISWLIAKLYAQYPLPQSGGSTFARLLPYYEPSKDSDRESFQQRVDRILTASLSNMEPELRWGLAIIASGKNAVLDWVQLTDDLSIWDRGTAHRRNKKVCDIWVEEYLEARKNKKERETKT